MVEMIEMIVAGVIHHTARRLHQHKGRLTVQVLVDAAAGAVVDVSEVLRRVGFKTDAKLPKMQPPMSRSKGSNLRKRKGGRQ